LPDLIRGFASKKTVEIRNPQSTRPWQHVIDPLYGYLLTAESILSGKTTPAFNFGPLEESLSVQEVAELAQSTWGQQTKVEFTESESAPYEAGLLELDATLAEKELGWMPLMSQKDSVISTVSWWKRKLNGEMSAEEACEGDLERYEF
jgi:CDP-glucose 4,6-dehydratase